MAGGIPVDGVSELVLEVVDLAAAETFYAGVFGFPVVDRWEDGGRIWLMAGTRTRIGLWRPQLGIANGRGGLHVHYALHIADGLSTMPLRAYGNRDRRRSRTTIAAGRSTSLIPTATSSNAGPGM